MPKWDRIEDVPESELPPLTPVPEPVSPQAVPHMPESPSAKVGGSPMGDHSSGRTDTTLLSILNTLTRIEQMLHQMNS